MRELRGLLGWLDVVLAAMVVVNASLQVHMYVERGWSVWLLVAAAGLVATLVRRPDGTVRVAGDWSGRR